MRLLIFGWLLLVAVPVTAQSDTLNRVDSLGKKYGYWIRYGKDKPDSGFSKDDLLEEGRFVDGKKQGLWKTYYPGNKIKAEVPFVNNRPAGIYKTYYENGQMEEKGNWKRAYNIDSFYRYHSNGVMAQRKFFNSEGKAEGWVEYWRINGELEYKYFARNGVEVADSVYRYSKEVKEIVPENKIPDSILCRCNLSAKKYLIKTPGQNGDTTYQYDTLHYEIRLQGSDRKQVFKSGTCRVSEFRDHLSISTREYIFDNGKLKLLPKVPGGGVKDGYNKLYNGNKQLIFDGEFKGGKLFNGKKYLYDKNGLLSKIEIYKSGKYMGDDQMDQLIEKTDVKK